ncbi:MAG: 3-dehydroquinate synthase [Clostridiales bacterium]|jgi:3-dehydroquinate synthase|nr:3-dehydroquinate synthase [Clostridiales bacterium]
MITIEPDQSDVIAETLASPNAFAVTDANVYTLYGPLFKGAKYYVTGAGENYKTLDAVEAVCKKMLESGCGRASRVVAVGGGVVGDTAGFAAAVFMRGVEWVNVPTTLLAQVDSGVGGKTGVNLGGYKNIIGAFHNPQSVIVSLNFLKTLPGRERLCGLGEIIKTAFLDGGLNAFIDAELSALMSFEPSALEKAVRLCIAFKQKIVGEDFRETTGRRKILNLGHTVGHALETVDCHRLSHGEYVLWGLLYEAFLTKDYINPLHYLKMTTTLRRVLKGKKLVFDAREAAAAALADKKNAADGRVSVIASRDIDSQKEMTFTVREIEESMTLCKKEFGL